MKKTFLTLLLISLVFTNILISNNSFAKTGLKLPRFVSLSKGEVNVRNGPDKTHPIKWVMHRKRMPVEIIAEAKRWRMVRDIQGDEGWVHQALLSPKRSVIVTGETQVIYDRASTKSAPLARIEVGAEASLNICNKEFCKITAEGIKGWIDRRRLWGIYPNEMND